ncbi:unnamed protein product [Acanthoscelides obtectus]|uniref:Cysteine-rich PDZ-binding protein n=1 Tax=Acanthoscelides obtectus TaxID=200917 RepID=A0A9P0MMA4_ACAOB|nr:unnamed protein product [Acanthoscelides obtectus]CAH2016123.1 unnamed protein product [Acanthoscelides obtectus]CAK1619990.1 Cysteine-rich PDZ-binding protein [Acanthoscelides obtectus]CAK1620001.1 Cysteine-rich PDZ-binding protein [Acanthoscelides obtectus]
MVCDKCQKKVGKVITPDPWKSGARNTTESGGRVVNENKALTASKNRFNPYTTKFETCSCFGLRLIHSQTTPETMYENAMCSGMVVVLNTTGTPSYTGICRQKVHQAGSHYCQACAYKKGICAMCGKKIISTKNYKQSAA